LRVRGRVLEVDIREDQVTYILKEGEDLSLYHVGEEIRLTWKDPKAVRQIPNLKA